DFDRRKGERHEREGGFTPPSGLSAQTELLDQLPVPLNVLLLQVVQKSAALPDHLVQATAGMVVLLVDLQVTGKLVDSLREDGDLDHRRARIRSVSPVSLDNRLFLFAPECHAQRCTSKIFQEDASRQGDRWRRRPP